MPKKKQTKRVKLPPPQETKAALPGIPMTESPLTEPTDAIKNDVTFFRIFLKATGLAILFALIMLLVTALALAGYAYRQIQKFSSVSEVPISQLKQQAERGWSTTPIQTSGRKNILLLGTDSLANRGKVPPLTDTMMLISLDLNSGTIYSLSFPRDIWSVEYKTKINSLYSYGLTRYPEEPERFPREVLEQMTGIPIHHTVVLTLDTVAGIIDQVGGIEVDVAQGFTDPEFPRSDVDITTERDPAKLYETVIFEAGKQMMSGEQVLKYVRSRHSEGDTGTDISRGQRQQAVLDALMRKVLDPKTLTNPETAGKLYKLYNNNFAQVFPITELIATGRALYPHKETITQKPHTFSIYPEDPNGVLINPPISKYKVWVYEVRDPVEFKQEVAQDLEITLPATQSATTETVPTVLPKARSAGSPPR